MKIQVKPDTVAQEMWDTLDDPQKDAVIEHEALHAFFLLPSFALARTKEELK